MSTGALRYSESGKDFKTKETLAISLGAIAHIHCPSFFMSLLWLTNKGGLGSLLSQTAIRAGEETRP
jgi:hypothetical protein